MTAKSPHFLLSTTPAAGKIQDSLGTPAYSYFFAVEALAPILDRVGSWELVEHPESRLPFLADRARAAGFEPIHLAVNPLQDVYFAAGMPNIVLPFWEFPDLPDRDFEGDPRQNWRRLARGASLILAACEFTAEAFRSHAPGCPVAVVPVPIAPESFDLPPWDAGHSWTLNCRHEILGRVAQPIREESRLGISPPRGPVGRFLRSAFRAVAPWMGPVWVDRIGAIPRKIRGLSPGMASFQGVRGAYRRYLRPCLSETAVARITAIKESALRAVGKNPSTPMDPLLPSSPLTLGPGLVYTSIFNVGDPRKNWSDLLSAFLLAFRDRDDVTLVIKLVTSRRCEHHEAGLLRSKYESMGIAHRCRVVVITEYLSDLQMNELFRSTTFYVNTSHAEGACLPLMRALAGGRPAIAPRHSAMADYMDEQVGFAPRSNPEPTCWPHDPEKRLSTTRHRLVWSDLQDAFLESARVAEQAPDHYEAMATKARLRLARHAGHDVAEMSLRSALSRLHEQTASGQRFRSAS